jgi:hypothetical protein
VREILTDWLVGLRRKRIEVDIGDIDETARVS